MRIAALDLGTNTFLCLIAEIKGSTVEEIIADEAEVVRLGQEVNQTKRFHPDALARAEKALAHFAHLIKQHKPEKTLAMATSAARDVENAEKLFALAEKFNIPLQIIPGDKEASITYLGAISGQNDLNKNRLIVDVGGGSTEFILGNGLQISSAQSLNLGCVRLTEKFLIKSPCADSLIQEVQNYIEQEMNQLDIKNYPQEILAVAGTPTELIKVELGCFDRNKIDGAILNLDKLKEWVDIFSKLSKEQIINRYGVHPGRADVILVGTLILLEVLKKFKKEKMLVSTRGVRFGIALEMVK